MSQRNGDNDVRLTTVFRREARILGRQRTSIWTRLDDSSLGCAKGIPLRVIPQNGLKKSQEFEKA